MTAKSSPICWSCCLPILAAIALLLTFSGCKVTKNLESHENLLIKNKIKVIGYKVPTDELEAYIQQHPNKKLFGLFRTNIAFYNMASKGDDTKFKKWIRTKIGSAPVLLDTSLSTITAKQMNLYLANIGYFQSLVTDSIIIKKKKATVIYKIIPSQPYTIKSISYSIPDTQLANYVYRDTSKCLIKKGANYDAYILDSERTRVTGNLLNQGFYRFNSSFISFRVDSNFRQHKIHIILEITNPVVPSFDNFTLVRQVPHKRYFINKIYIFPEFDHLQTFAGVYDTLVRTYDNPEKNDQPCNYYFLYQDRFKTKPRTIAQSIFITPKSNYNLFDVNQSYSQLASLGVFRYINIQFKDPPENELNKKNDQIDCLVELSRSPVHSFTSTFDGTNSAGAFGVQGSLGYQNRNIFRGAQLFRFSVTGSLQMQASEGMTTESFFNVIEVGVTAGLTFPQFLLPIKPERLSKYFKPKTTVSISYNYQHQFYYDRHISNITFGYSWLQSKSINHVLNPIEISLVKMFPQPEFANYIDTVSDARLRNQYTDHMVAGLRYTFTFNNQQVSKVKDFIYIRANFETGGNLIYGIQKLFNASKNDKGYYTLFDLPYSQYVRPTVDARYYNVFRNQHSLVYRFFAGVGVPYGNSVDLPFEKAFFAGGSNGMRGWKMYTLGPGSYKSPSDQITFTQIGDIQLEANIEYRFPVYDWIRGAVFVDAGNIWLLKDSESLPGGKFEFPGFLDVIGIDAGIGIRLDFDFFVVRLDPAIPIRVPSYPTGDRWYFSKMQLGDIIWNFGIGYPF